MIGKYSLFFLFITSIISCHTVKKLPPPPPPEISAVPIEIPAKAIISDSLQPKVNMNKTDEFLENLLKSRPEFTDILANRDSLKIQVIYTQIDRLANNQPVFKKYYFNLNRDNYFYPASTVKMPVAMLALQRLNELKVFGLNSYSSMITEKAFNGQTAVYNDPTTADGRPTIAHYIKKIFLVSDNDAFNRLYEFLGQEYINTQLKKMGYPSTDILHRLSLPLTEEENRHTNPVTFYNTSAKILYSQPMQVNNEPYPQRSETVGKGYMLGDKMIDSALNFSKKNRVALEDLAGMLQSIIFPYSVPVKQRFNLTPEDYSFVLKYMSQYPGETLFPSYDSSNYWNAYSKFLLFGSEKGKPPGNIRIFNKEGDAYGFLTDIAYVVDFENNIEFMLSATIYCNSDGILNDDKYDYETIGLPFMKNLGKLVYDYELTRDRDHQPDLSAFKILYDK